MGCWSMSASFQISFIEPSFACFSFSLNFWQRLLEPFLLHFSVNSFWLLLNVPAADVVVVIVVMVVGGRLGVVDAAMKVTRSNRPVEFVLSCCKDSATRANEEQINATNMIGRFILLLK